jgi:hypothetical protein
MKNLFALTFCFLFVVGCGGSKARLGGTVTFEEDGKPVPNGSVFFATETYSAKGTIKDGKYVMGSTDTNDGLPAGKYKVYISGATEEIKGTEHSLIDPKYADYASTPLTCDVPVAGNTFDIKVPKNQK